MPRLNFVGFSLLALVFGVIWLGQIESSSFAQIEQNDSRQSEAREIGKLAQERRFSAKELTECEKRIEAELAETTLIEFINTPFLDGIEYLRMKHDVVIVIDESVGDRRNGALSFISKHQSFGESLDLMLGPSNLTYIVRDGAIIIIDQKQAGEFVEPRIYSLRDVDGSIFHLPELLGTLNEQFDVQLCYDTQLNINRLILAVQGEGWLQANLKVAACKPGKHRIIMLHGAVYVMTDYRTHLKIERVLAQLAKVNLK